jgi:hypothetical protein
MLERIIELLEKECRVTDVEGVTQLSELTDSELYRVIVDVKTAITIGESAVSALVGNTLLLLKLGSQIHLQRHPDNDFQLMLDVYHPPNWNGRDLLDHVDKTPWLPYDPPDSRDYRPLHGGFPL